MKKLVLLSLVLGSIGVAHADSDVWKTVPINKDDYQQKEEVKASKNNFDVFVSSTSSKTSQGDEGNGYSFGASYTSYQTENVFLQPSVQFTNLGNSYNDKMYLANFDVGYTYRFQNGITLSPKAGLGFFKAVYDEGSNFGGSYNYGVEIGLNKSLAVDVTRIHAYGQSSGNYVDLTSVSLKYKF
ncbi:hypothetical protein DFLDMN_001617 [Cupriavidus sp. H19C3]|uniref:outer membrane beta-barrel protein n=1 Tax=Cupriavidus sp. H19C3 TaxID=3241603 RepID=UPI003BF8CDD0